ncbi:amidohydrolase family protein [Bacillus marasmi]|uniref:amidohydrolase family protein n=1 Tax=Bacillus marasmi TaxID=1926279 RepID=UPI001FE9C721|nr:amidohydrolase family protein [Bacillus marasmi]
MSDKHKETKLTKFKDLKSTKYIDTKYEDTKSTKYKDGKSTSYKNDKSTKYKDEKTTSYKNDNSTKYHDDKTTSYKNDKSTKYKEDKTTSYKNDKSTKYKEDKSTKNKDDKSTKYKDTKSAEKVEVKSDKKRDTKDQKRIIIRGATIVTMNRNRDVLYNQDILVVGNRIKAIGDCDNELDRADEVINAKGQIIIPGLVQTHLHLTQTLQRNLVADQTLEQWLNTTLALEAAHDADSNFWSSMLGISELFLNGTTTIYDMETTFHTNSCFEAMEETGIRGFAGKAMIDQTERGVNIPEIMIQPTDVAFGESVDLFEKWDGRKDGRLRYCFVPRYAPFCSTRLLKLTGDFSAKYGAHVHTHAAETEEEEQVVIENTGMREVEYYDSVGLINPRTVLAHCVHLNDREIDILARRGCHVSHCPSANLYLASGIAPIPKMLKRGVNVSIGPDGSDNNNLDNILEMRLAALLQKGLHQNPTIQPSAKKALEMATMGGARALGLENEIGSIEVGKKADLAILDLRKPHSWPNEAQVNSEENIYTRIVYSANAADVVLTMVDGKVVMRDRKLLTIDKYEVLQESNQAIKRLLRRTGLDR